MELIQKKSDFGQKGKDNRIANIKIIALLFSNDRSKSLQSLLLPSNQAIVLSTIHLLACTANG
jgi:hypothetical protein